MHTKFSYKSLEELVAHIKDLELDIGYTEDLQILTKPVKLNNHIIPNALATHPVEGGDAENGCPTELTFRKYENVASKGVGLIWLESVSVTEDGLSSNKQLYINKHTLSGFKELASRINKAAEKSPIYPQKPITILQLNHSGRYSKPKGKSVPIIASKKPELDRRFDLPDDYPIVDDAYLSNLIDYFVQAAVLAKEAGFDGVDIKACHGYLLHELLSCFDRDGIYGGSFENRTALMLKIIDEIRIAVNDSNFIIAARINLYDGLPRSKSWGTDATDHTKSDLTEPIKLVQELVKRGCQLINATIGIPYFLQHINRPYDIGAYYPEEHPLEGIYRLLYNTRQIQQAVPEAKIVGTGYSWLREFSPYIGAWALENGGASLIGYGRMSIAYPDFAADIIKEGKLYKNKVCVSCSKCSDLRRNIGTCGCVVRDSKTYLKLYNEVYCKQIVI